jgi:paraquat-inducible protein B
MAKQVSKTVIGVFVISAIAMLIAGVIILGSGALFKDTVKYVMFFNQSLKGLSVGSPVLWRGVKIGSVSSITLDANAKKLAINIPVVVEIDRNSMKVEGERPRNMREQIDRMIKQGLRAQIGMQSLVTGQQEIDVDFMPGTPVHLSGIKSEYPEIPTVPSSMEQFSKKLEGMPIQEIAEKLLNILAKADKVLSSPEMTDLAHNLSAATKNASQLMQHTDMMVESAQTQLKSLSESTQATLGTTQTALKEVSNDARALLKAMHSQVPPVMTKVRETLVSAQRAMDQATHTLATANSLIGENSNTRLKLNASMDEIASAARSLNSLMSYLDRHPEALLKGRGGSGK